MNKDVTKEVQLILERNQEDGDHIFQIKASAVEFNKGGKIFNGSSSLILSQDLNKELKLKIKGFPKIPIKVSMDNGAEIILLKSKLGTLEKIASTNQHKVYIFKLN